MCIPTGKADLMSPQERIRYKEAVPSKEELALEIPNESQYDNSIPVPKDQRVKMLNGKLGTAKEAQKLKEFLNKRKK